MSYGLIDAKGHKSRPQAIDPGGQSCGWNRRIAPVVVVLVIALFVILATLAIGLAVVMGAI